MNYNYKKVDYAPFVTGVIIGALVAGLSTYAIMSGEKSDDMPLTVYEVPNKRLVLSSFFFDIIVPENQFYRILENPGYLKYVPTDIVPREDLRSFYSDIAYDPNLEKAIVIYPIFTETAYSNNGFYDFYRGECDESCLTKEVGNYPPHYTASKNGFKVLSLLGYESITDLELHRNLQIIYDYDKVILLHNEYVTIEMFDALTSHPNVVYLYPNALYAQVEYNEDDNTITLIRGHAYPSGDIDNGFDWEFDNTRPAEYDTDCLQWRFEKIDNGHMLTCYPELYILKDPSLLRAIKNL